MPLDQDSVKSLEATNESVHLGSGRRALPRRSTSHLGMPSLQLLKKQMLQVNTLGFARRLVEQNMTKQC